MTNPLPKTSHTMPLARGKSTSLACGGELLTASWAFRGLARQPGHVGE